tara:strand:+ start:3138 stop:4220 length:1083 start_codon:yes stop_codon:yes gene_type:complete
MAINVFTRVKDGNIPIHSRTKNGCIIQIPSKTKEISCHLNDVWQSDTTNAAIFAKLIEKSSMHRDNYWVAFGYTGSGKSYTISGLLEQLLGYFINTPLGITISGYQIYNEKLYDIFNGNQVLRVWKTNEIRIKGLRCVKVVNVKNIMLQIERNRHLAKTTMNCVSSRSHAIFSLSAGNQRFILVDMAGQESGKTAAFNNNEIIKKEGTDINLNMLALKDCITSSHLNKKHIPFRRCLLTMALKPIFQKKCTVSFISTISLSQNTFYCYDTLKYASALFYHDPKQEEKEKLCKTAFSDLTKYLCETKYIECEEKILWNEMKGGNYQRLPTILNLLDSKISKALKYKQKIKKYSDKLPDIIN